MRRVGSYRMLKLRMKWIFISNLKTDKCHGFAQRAFYLNICLWK